MNKNEVYIDAQMHKDAIQPNSAPHFELLRELDPTERPQHTPGVKLDSGKNRLGLVIHGFARALKAVGEVGTKGAVKYTPNGWMEVPNGIERYTDALYRHLLEEAVGEKFDKELDVLHAACTAWNALARLDLIIREMETEEI